MEVWKDIEGTSGRYQVSNHGRIKSVARVIEQKRHDIDSSFRRSWPEKILKQSTDSYGYKVVSINVPGKNRTNKVHRLVAQAFLSNDNKLDQINHIDGDKANNSLNNLEWCTAKQNSIHRSKVLGFGSGSSNGRAKLTDDDVMKIDEMLCAGFTVNDVAKSFNIGYNTALRVKLGDSWSHITGRRRAA